MAKKTAKKETKELSKEEQDKKAAAVAEAKIFKPDPTGIQETMQVLKAMKMISVFLTKRLKDGFQTQDAFAFVTAIATNPEFRDVLVAAADNISQVPHELKDLDLGETGEIAKAGLDMAMAIVGELKTR